MKTELLLGCGNNRAKKLSLGDTQWHNLITLDFDPDCKPDVLHDLEVVPYPFADDTFDEIHAYEVLEHVGTQGDWKAFFDQFGEIHRMLKPKGLLFASVPSYQSVWAWGDPSHKRVINHGSLAFLSQKNYEEQVGKTAMTDFRRYWKRDFNIVGCEYKGENMFFVLEAVK